MAIDTIMDERIPFSVESPRGDDTIGTNPAGDIISDHEARVQGIEFQAGVPKDRLPEAVKRELINDKWVFVQKKDGSTDLFTGKDIPLLYPAPEQKQEPVDDWKSAFNLNNTKPKEKVKGGARVKQTVVNQTCEDEAEKEDEPEKENKPEEQPKATDSKKCDIKPKAPVKPKEVWESKFENITSACATHKGKGG